MKKYKLCRKAFEVWKKDIYLLPTVRICTDYMLYSEKNFFVEFHFMIFHARLLFLEKEVTE